MIEFIILILFEIFILKLFFILKPRFFYFQINFPFFMLILKNTFFNKNIKNRECVIIKFLYRKIN